MSESKFYKSKQVYGETFFQLPKVLFTNKKYKKMSSDAKLAYALLKDRFTYSIKNNWIDNEDNLYFIFTNEELMTLLDVGNQKVVKVKKELEKVELLLQKRKGLNKPNRLYWLRPEVEATDVYLQSIDENVDNSGNVKITHNLYKKLTKDTYKDTVVDTTKEELQNRELLQSFSETQDQTFLDKRCLELIALFSNTIQEAHNAIGIIIRAKNKQEKNMDEY